mgnify:CR=1 FL=1
MLYYLTVGVLLGVTAGFSPGPLLTLVISETLEHGIASGIRVALAPVITDAPIILVSSLVFTQLSEIENILGIISLIGGGYVLYIGYGSFRAKAPAVDQKDAKPKSLTRGILANALSPHPYLFWFSVGAPTIAKALSVNILAPLLFIGGFYFFLVGAKVVLAVLVGKSRSFFSDNAYVYTMRFLGVLLGGFSMLLFADGLELLGVLET